MRLLRDGFVRRHPPFVMRSRLAFALRGKVPARGVAIGLLGGSFNPPHAGHIAISVQAYTKLRLHEVWWLVVPRNPLKKTRIPSAANRLAQTREIALPGIVRSTCLEQLLHDREYYTADTIGCLSLWFPGVRFVWLMGADNFAQVHLWKDWKKIFAAVPVAILDRPGWTQTSLHARAAREFRTAQLSSSHAGCLLNHRPPVWTFLSLPHNFQSSQAMRKLARVSSDNADR